MWVGGWSWVVSGCVSGARDTGQSHSHLAGRERQQGQGKKPQEREEREGCLHFEYFYTQQGEGKTRMAYLSAQSPHHRSAATGTPFQHKRGAVALEGWGEKWAAHGAASGRQQGRGFIVRLMVQASSLDFWLKKQIKSHEDAQEELCRLLISCGPSQEALPRPTVILCVDRNDQGRPPQTGSRSKTRDRCLSRIMCRPWETCRHRVRGSWLAVPHCR